MTANPIVQLETCPNCGGEGVYCLSVGVVHGSDTSCGACQSCSWCDATGKVASAAETKAAMLRRHAPAALTAEQLAQDINY